MKCYLLIGLPGSGKSVLTDKIIQENPNAIILSMDSIIDKFAKENNMTYRQVWANHIKIAEKEFEDTIQKAMHDKKDIIWDQTNLHQLSRAPKIKRLVENSYEVEGIALELSSVEWKNRIQHREANGGKTMLPDVLEQMEKSYQSPEYSEGFNKIYIVNDKNEISLKFKQPNLQANIKNNREKMYPTSTDSIFKYNKQ